MDAQQFAYWLQGFAELNAEPPSPEQWQSIREHLATVFTKVTPPLNPVNRPYEDAMKPYVAPWMPLNAAIEKDNHSRPLTAECSNFDRMNRAVDRADYMGKTK